MKKFIYSIFCVVCCAQCLSGCRSNVSDLVLDGSCDITALTIDNQYNAIIDQKTHTITVWVPMDYNRDVLTVTDIKLSEGASTTLTAGMKIALREPRVIRVVNGDVSLCWTLVARNDEARILTFKLNDIFAGVINQENLTIRVSVPTGTDLTAMTVSATLSERATMTPNAGLTMSFAKPVEFTVVMGTDKNVYTVTVIEVANPKALFIGSEASIEELQPEEAAACDWMLKNIDNSLYASWKDIKSKTISLEECEVIWCHIHKDGGLNGAAAFEAYAPDMMSCKTILQDYFNAGGSFFFTRYAVNFPAYLSINGNEATGAVPNNCWGGNESTPEETGGPWDFSMKGHSDHPFYQGIIAGDDPEKVYTCDKGYMITNSTAQWHIGEDWGGVPTPEAFETKTGAKIVSLNGDAVVAWEFPRSESNGAILCLGSGAYDWYSTKEVYTGFHQNVEILTKNAFNYLKK